MADHIESIAKQVRGGERSDLAVHKLIKAATVDGVRRYYVRCGRYFYADEGAILTTNDATCTLCQGTALVALPAVRAEPETAGDLVGAPA